MMAGIQGFEPRLKASKASVLPLDDIPICTALLYPKSEKASTREHFNQRKLKWEGLDK